MRPRLAWTAVAAAAGLLGAAPPAPAGPVDFSRDVLPILSAHCFACHGPDAAKRKADLRLDVRAGAVAGTAVVPGRPDQSELIARLTAEDADGRMPPPKAGARLSADQVRVLRAWIEQGAEYTEHWAFVPPRRPVVPEIRNPKSEIRNEIDAFVVARLEKEGLRPAGRATAEVLVRRATLDLTGLPPTVGEVERYLESARAQPQAAYGELVERLLASPHYGERWGRHWLDVARYADSGGFETDIVYGNAWRYRDYVIRAFNADLPFNQFVREQIAGDELRPADRQALVATALYAVGPVLQEADMVRGKLEYDWLTDATDTTGAAFLGLTLGCARCHDHKYDPVSQKDYFALQAVFAGSNLFDFNADGSVLQENVLLRKTEKELDRARANGPRPKQRGHFDEYPDIPLRGLGKRTKPLAVRLLQRGELDDAGEPVAPGLPARLAAGSDGRSRTALADWVASDKNPLTARVIVNRVWQWHFGQGLVRTPNDFGTRGERPTHPELLDWLAVDFMEHGWSLKHLHRRIMLSATYLQSSAADGDVLRRDPDNRLLARFQPRRVEAETVWDAMRAAAGTLDRRMYGPPVGPSLDARELIGNYRKWPASPPAEAERRGVYIVVRRSFRFPALGAFDLPENNASCGQRDCTVVANQALTLLNGRATRDPARAFADRLLRETDGSPEAVAARAWRHAYGRPIADDERHAAVAFLKARQTVPKAEADAARRAAVEELCLALFNTSEFIYLP